MGLNYNRSIYLETKHLYTVWKLLKQYDNIDPINKFHKNRTEEQIKEYIQTINSEYITIYLGDSSKYSFWTIYGWDYNISYSYNMKPVYWKKYFKIFRKEKLKRIINNKEEEL